MYSKRKAEKIRKAALKQSRQQLTELSGALNEAYRSFNSVTDPVAMDVCIHEINALRSRRDALLQDIRKLE